jgi:integration host factor subunit beta
MTKADLVEAVIDSTGVTKREAEMMVNTFLESIIDSLNKGEGVELRGFGSFRIRSRGGRVGRNPRTGESVNVPPKKVPYFKVGKELKELINK